MGNFLISEKLGKLVKNRQETSTGSRKLIKINKNCRAFIREFVTHRIKKNLTS